MIMIWRLLRKNISIARAAGYALANIVGLTLVLCAVEFYQDLAPIVSGRDSLGSDYIVISRPVSMLSVLGVNGDGKGISPYDIDELMSQPWVEDVGEFTSADFGISASVNFGGHDMWTYLFLESVPDRFLDAIPDRWEFDPSDPQAEVPVVISREYLALYNFGFASSRGLPQLSEGMITQVPLRLYVSGNGISANFKARIVGFSDRLNTIAVPEAFMQWANATFGSGGSTPSRLIVKMSDPGNSHISEFLEAKGYEVANEGLHSGKVHYMLTLLTAVVAVVGIVICMLALFIIMLNISLLMQKNKEKNHGLLLLGYSPASIEACYAKAVVIINASVLAASVAVMLVLSHIWRDRLAQIGVYASSSIAAMGVGFAVMCAVTAVNYLSIRRAVRRCFYANQ